MSTSSAVYRVLQQGIDPAEREAMYRQLRNAAQDVGLSTTREVLEETGLSLDESFTQAKAKFSAVKEVWIQRFPQLQSEIGVIASDIYSRELSAAW